MYKITNILAKNIPYIRVGNNTISDEKSRYNLSNIWGTSMASKLQNNNPNAVRKSKRSFASDMPLDSPVYIPIHP